MKKLYRFLSSIQLTIILTYIIVVVTMVGSFSLLYNKSAFEAIDAGILIEWLKVSSFAASWWIILLVLFIFVFAMNTIFCTYHRVALLFKAWKGRAVSDYDDEETFISEDVKRGKGVRFRTLIPYISHAGFIIALVGHLTGSIWGFRGADFFVPTGETAQIAEAKGVSLKVDEVFMKIGNRGYPEEMSAEVTLFYDGELVKKHSVEINSPLLHDNMAVYVKNVSQNLIGLKLVQRGKDGRTSAFQLSSGEAKVLADGIRIVAGRTNARYAAMELLVYTGSKLQGRKWLSASDPQYSSFNFNGVKLTVSGGRYEEGAVLNVNRDPGVWIVLTGLAIFVFSLGIHLFLRRSK